jgi:hypothetical protein
MSWFLVLPPLARKVLIGFAALFVFASGFGIWLVIHDHGVVKADRAKVEAKVTKTVLEAEHTADRNDESRRVVRERNTDALRHVREQAIRDEPVASQQEAGPAVRAVLAELRQQRPEAPAP